MYFTLPIDLLGIGATETWEQDCHNALHQPYVCGAPSWHADSFLILFEQNAGR